MIKGQLFFHFKSPRIFSAMASGKATKACKFSKIKAF